MMQWRLGVVLVVLAGCAGPTGPVVGDWRGFQPTISSFDNLSTELILDGEPDARAGTYHLVTRAMEPGLVDDPRWNVRWTDQWERRVVQDANGRSYTTIHLHRAPGAQVPDYILTANNLLVPLDNPQHPDLSANALRIALVPLPRSSWGYGRP